MTNPTNAEDPLSIPSWVNNSRPPIAEASSTPYSAELRSKPRHMKRGTAVILAALLGGGAGYAANDVLRFIDDTTQRTVHSVIETMPNGGNDIQLAKQAVIDLGLSPKDVNVVSIGQNVKDRPEVEQPGEQVKFDEVHHWYGDTIEGTVVDDNK